MTAANPFKIYRKPAIKDIFCIAESTIFLHQKKGLIPKAIQLGPRAVGWPASEIDAIYAARIAGKTEEDIKALVVKLTADRKLTA